MQVQPPRYIAVEGPIGVGKTSLARKLASEFHAEASLEEPDDNPFLARFYEHPRRGALAAQLCFLMQRARQVEALRQGDMLSPTRIADFMFEKDRLFARLTLDKVEFELYRQIYAHLAIDAPRPDLVVYLQAPADVLVHRIRKRGRSYEQSISRDYLKRVSESYAEFFCSYVDAPLLIVNAAEIDLVDNEEDFQVLLKQICKPPAGRRFFNPLPLIV